MNKPKILKLGESYTFSKYFELPFTTKDILADLNCKLERAKLLLPKTDGVKSLDFLNGYLQRNLNYINPVRESAIREILIVPIILEICAETESEFDIEYPIAVSEWLKGTLDYFISGQNSFLVVEAKQSDLNRGFTQLAVELIALDQWIDSESPVIYGAVTNGVDWRFGLFRRQERLIVQDIDLYRVPEGLENLLKVLVGVLQYHPLSLDESEPSET